MQRGTAELACGERCLFEQLKKGSLWALLSRIVGSASAFVVSMQLARVLAVDTLGAYFLFLQMLTLMSLLVKMGMDSSLQKVLGIAAANNDWGAVRAYLRIVALTMALATMLMAFLLYPSWSWLTQSMLNAPALAGVGVLVLLAVPLRAMEELGSTFFRSVNEARIGVFLLDVPRQVVLIVLFGLLLLLVGKVSIETALFSYLGASALSVAIGGLLLVAWLYRHGVGGSGPSARTGAVDFWKLSFPMLLHGGAAVLLSTGDMWVLGVYTTTHDVAIYGAVVRLTMLVVLGLNIVNMVIPPMLATLYAQGDTDGLEQLLRKSASWSVYIVAPVLVLFLGWGSGVIALAFGDVFRGGAFVLGVLAVAHSVNALCGSPGMLLQMTGHHYLLMRLTIVWALINLTLAIAAVKPFGMNGVGIVTGLSIIGQNLCMVHFAKSRLGVRTWARWPGRLAKIV